jgi:hypothetical protein
MTRIIVIVAVILAFSAGLVVGMQRSSVAPPKLVESQPSNPPNGSLLIAGLNLDQNQQKLMNEIWSRAASFGQIAYNERLVQARRERDEAVQTMLALPLREQFDQINKTYQDRIAAIDKEWRDNYYLAVEKTRAILNPDQLTIYNAIMGRLGPGPGPGFGGRGRRGARGNRGGGPPGPGFVPQPGGGGGPRGQFMSPPPGPWPSVPPPPATQPSG